MARVALLDRADPAAGRAGEEAPRAVRLHTEVPTDMASKPTKTKAVTRAVKTHATAESMATKQKEIAVSEFFAKNRHLLGFDNPRKALLTTVKEAVDNSLDACEEAGILPTLHVSIEALNGGAQGGNG